MLRLYIGNLDVKNPSNQLNFGYNYSYLLLRIKLPEILLVGLWIKAIGLEAQS